MREGLFTLVVACTIAGCGGCGGPECHVGADCGDDARCTEALTCEPDPDFTRCESDAECAADRRCEAAQCVRLEGGACRVSATCPAEAARCVAGQCVECERGEDCPSGLCAADGRCEGAGPEVLPERVWFRTGAQSFNREWYVALKDGRIHVKPNLESSTQPPGEWRPLGSGLPEGAGIQRFPAPERIVSVSADGTHLQALSSAGVFYRGDDFRKADLSGFTWTDAWGWPGAQGPGLREEFSAARGWNVSDSHPFDVGHYEDRNGIEHSVGLGVAHAYRLDPDGHRLRFNDWWLAADWSRQICLPDRGAFTAVALSVSASTIFVLDARGRMFTRLYDFDTSGENDLLTYSYLITGSSGTTRALPAEPWRRQPDLPGARLTRRIAIFQNGKGNAARVLRVEGVKEGRTGFYFKDVLASAWSFHETGLPMRGDPLGAPEAEPAPADRRVVAKLTREDVPDGITLELTDFNLECSPAVAHVLWNGAPVTLDGAPLELPFHHVHRLVTTIRTFDYMDRGVASDVRAALLVPEAIARVQPVAARDRLVAVLENRRVVNFTGTATRTGLDLTELSWADNFQAPLDERCSPWNHVRLKSE